MNRFGVIFICALAVTLINTSYLKAEIYTYKDSNGVRHFTNVPNSPKYKLFMSERKGMYSFRKGSCYSRSVAKAIKHTTFDPIIKEAATKYGLDSALIKAVITAESAFNCQAVSPKGAKGLMQIMPENYNSLDISDPFDPSENIMGGSKYLRQMLEVNNGRLRLALAAYNAGPEAVRKYEGIPPYDETIEYVTRVIDLYRQYRDL